MADGPGHSVCHPVHVNWPELQLTEAQMMANALAASAGLDVPYPDPALIDLIIPRFKLTKQDEPSKVSASLKEPHAV